MKQTILFTVKQTYEVFLTVKYFKTYPFKSVSYTHLEDIHQHQAVQHRQQRSA